MVTCSIPYQLADKFAGVATTDIRLDNVASFMQQQGGRTGGYAFVVDKQGQILYFPQNDRDHYKTVGDLVKASAWLSPVAQRLQKLRTATTEVSSVALENDGILNAPSRVMLFPMADTGWVVGLVTPQERIVGLAKVMMRDVLEVLIPVMTLLLVGSWLVVRRLIARLDDTRRALDDIAQGEGDLTRRLEVRGKDEISAIAQAFNLFVDKISAILLTVRSSSEVANNAVSLADSNTELSSRVTQQAAALEESAAAMEQLNATVHQNASNTQLADELSESTAQTANRCGDVMHEVISTMDNVSASSGRMVEIVSVIDSIAFQTNILALNASVNGGNSRGG